MKKRPIWDNPDKMHFNSDLKSFNKQVILISPGNVLGDEQLSLYIRPYNEKFNPIGDIVQPGDLQEWDLSNFKDVPGYVKDEVRTLAKDRTVILYEFRYWDNYRKIPVGWIITTGTDKEGGNKLLAEFVAKENRKYHSVLDEAKKYITGKNRLRA